MGLLSKRAVLRGRFSVVRISTILNRVERIVLEPFYRKGRTMKKKYTILSIICAGLVTGMVSAVGDEPITFKQAYSTIQTLYDKNLNDVTGEDRVGLQQAIDVCKRKIGDAFESDDMAAFKVSGCYTAFMGMGFGAIAQRNDALYRDLCVQFPNRHVAEEGIERLKGATEEAAKQLASKYKTINMDVLKEVFNSLGEPGRAFWRTKGKEGSVQMPAMSHRLIQTTMLSASAFHLLLNQMWKRNEAQDVD